jgi:hypothetical protein
MSDESFDRETQLLLKEAEWTWSEMEDFVRLVQRYRSLYVTALFVSIGWVLGQALGVAPGTADPASSQVTSQGAALPTTEVVLLRLRERPDIAAVLCIIPMLNAIFFLLMMEAARHLQSLARYRYLLGWKLAHNTGPIWRWELWKETREGSVRAWTNPSNVFLGLLALILTVGCFAFVFPAVNRSGFCSLYGPHPLPSLSASSSRSQLRAGPGDTEMMSPILRASRFTTLFSNP